MRNIHKQLLFIFVLLLTSFFFDYHNIIFKPPQSTHAWRQSDCASLALNYYKGGMRFFYPETHNLTSDGGTTGFNATSEIPLLYYSVALLWKVFGHHDIIYRLLNTLIFLTGLYFLFLTVKKLTNDDFLAFAIPLLIFSSPVLAYYANNFLTNSAAFSLSLIGWYWFFEYQHRKKLRLFVLSFLFFMLAGSMKLTAFFSVFALGGIFFLEWTGLLRMPDGNKIFPAPFITLFSFSLIILFVGAWVYYAHNYNMSHSTAYFSTTIFPIWNYSPESIIRILKDIRILWLNQYFHPLTLYLLGFLSGFILLNLRIAGKLFVFLLFFLFAELIVYFLLQFWTFRDHDYYTIDMYILPVFILLSASVILIKKYVKVSKSITFRIFLIVFVGFNLNNAKTNIRARYTGWWTNYYDLKGFYEIKPHLAGFGVGENDTVISIPDGSHLTLYLMDKKGWTSYTDERFGRAEPIYYNRNRGGVRKSIDHGARFMFIRTVEELLARPYLNDFTQNLAGSYRDILVFNLREPADPKQVTERKRINCLHCNFEEKDKYGFVTNGNLDFLESNTVQQNEEHIFSGVNSLKLDSLNPSGPVIKFDDLQYGQKITATVWRKSENPESRIIFSASDSKIFYYNSNEVVEEDTIMGWEKIKLELFVPGIPEVDEYRLYLYNPSALPVWFDDLKVEISWLF